MHRNLLIYIWQEKYTWRVDAIDGDMIALVRTDVVGGTTRQSAFTYSMQDNTLGMLWHDGMCCGLIVADFPVKRHEKAEVAFLFDDTHPTSVGSDTFTSEFDGDVLRKFYDEDKTWVNNGVVSGRHWTYDEAFRKDLGLEHASYYQLAVTLGSGLGDGEHVRKYEFSLEQVTSEDGTVLYGHTPVPQQ